MTKKRVEDDTTKMKRWVMDEMLKDTDMIERIEKREREGYGVYLIIPTGTYFSILFKIEDDE